MESYYQTIVDGWRLFRRVMEQNIIDWEDACRRFDQFARQNGRFGEELSVAFLGELDRERGSLRGKKQDMP